MRALAAIFVCVFLLGCTTTRTSNTARTATEQLLISNAVDQTLAKIPLPPVEGKKVFLDEKFLDCVDKGYLIASIRERLLREGAYLVPKIEDSEITIEVRSGGLGTDNVDSFVGMPSFAVPGPLPFQIPEVRVFERTSQYGRAKIALVAMDTATGGLIFNSGRQLAQGDDSRWSLFGMGPVQSGTVQTEIKQAINTNPVRLASGESDSTTR